MPRRSSSWSTPRVSTQRGPARSIRSIQDPRAEHGVEGTSNTPPRSGDLTRLSLTRPPVPVHYAMAEQSFCHSRTLDSAVPHPAAGTSTLRNGGAVFLSLSNPRAKPAAQVLCDAIERISCREAGTPSIRKSIFRLLVRTAMHAGLLHPHTPNRTNDKDPVLLQRSQVS